MGYLMTFSHVLSFRVVGDGGSISKGKICSLKARVSCIHLDSYIACVFKITVLLQLSLE